MPNTKNSILSPELKKQLQEVLNPRNTPEIAFQSYEYLGDASIVRNQQEKDFIEGRAVYPVLEYPLIDERELHRQIRVLDNIITFADGLEEPDRSTVWDTVAYRMGEMYWLLSVKRATNAYRNRNKNAPHLIAEAQELNEQLYGVPDPELHNQVLGEINAQINAKELNPYQQELLLQLTDGFSVDIGGQVIAIPALALTDKTDRLDVLDEETEAKVLEAYKESFPFVSKIVEDYYNEVIVKRPLAEKVFTVADMKVLFENCLEYMDPSGESGVEVIADDTSKSLAWSTPDWGVKIGMQRVSIDNISEMESVIAHELAIHASKAINGVKKRNPVLGAGLFTEANAGESPDYLTFEEGIASLTQKSIDKNRKGWDMLSMEKQLALGLAYEGLDFRQIFETLWRIRAVLAPNLTQDKIDEKKLATLKEESYKSCLRIFRGSPTERLKVDGAALVFTFNKDLAYLTGQIKAIRYCTMVSIEEIKMAMSDSKTDPTNPNHRAILEREEELKYAS